MTKKIYQRNLSNSNNSRKVQALRRNYTANSVFLFGIGLTRLDIRSKQSLFSLVPKFIIPYI